MCNPVPRSRAAFAYSRLSLRILISRNAVRQPINTMPNTMSSEAFRINDANNATPTTPKMSTSKMGSRAVRAKDVMPMPAARDIKEHHRKIRPLVDLEPVREHIELSESFVISREAA